MRTYSGKALICAGVAALFAAAAFAADPPPALGPEWQSLAFLVGEWVGVGGGQPGEGGGGSTFAPDLGGQILVRRNWAEMPAGRHEDLMVIYAAPGGGFRALYVDNEGHAINYAVTAEGAGATFESADAGAQAPRFRLVYRLAVDGTLTCRFDVKAPGAADYATYVEGTLRKK